MYFVGSIIMLLGIVLAGYFRGVPLAVFFNPSAVVIVTFTVVGVIVSTASFKTFIRGLNAVLSDKYSIDDEERNKAAVLFRLLSKSVIWASLISLLFCLLRVPSLPIDATILTHLLASAAVSPLFGITMSLIFFEPATHILKNRKPNL